MQFIIIYIYIYLYYLGTASSRRKDELARLNTEFQAMVKLKVSLSGAYHFLQETENYRMLSSQQYSWRESPLRSGRVCESIDRTQTIVQDKQEQKQQQQQQQPEHTEEQQPNENKNVLEHREEQQQHAVVGEIRDDETTEVQDTPELDFEDSNEPDHVPKQQQQQQPEENIREDVQTTQRDSHEVQQHQQQQQKQQPEEDIREEVQTTHLEDHEVQQQQQQQENVQSWEQPTKKTQTCQTSQQTPAILEIDDEISKAQRDLLTHEADIQKLKKVNISFISLSVCLSLSLSLMQIFFLIGL